MNLDSSVRLAALEFANRIDLIAAEAPDVHSEKAVHDVARTIRKRYTYSNELRKRELLTHLRRNADAGMSVGDLVEATAYSKDTIYPLINELIDAATIELRHITPAGKGAGRPWARYFPLENPIVSSKKS